jgi:FkbM family methyltransferase
VAKDLEHIDLTMPAGGKRRFYHRGTNSDLAVMQQMFQHQDYSCHKLRRAAELRETEAALAKPMVLDAGSNIGASVCWFAIRYPRSHIVAFEPEPANFELLERNTEGLDVELHNAALGSSDGMVSVFDPGEGEWGYRTEKSADATTPLVSVSRIVSEKVTAGFEPFLAKIDIEGGEADLFQPPTDWIDHFPLMIVELHDWMLPGQGTSRPFLQSVAGRDRDFVHLGENVFSIRN